MSGFDDSDLKRLLGIIERVENERESENAGLSPEFEFDTNFSDYPCDRMVSGLIFKGDGPELVYGNVYIEQGLIKEIEETRVKSENWIVPRFINAHTHIGDTMLKDPPLGNVYRSFAVQRDLDVLVKPPNGLKHKFLSGLSAEEAVCSMEAAIWDIYQNGISVFADFREGGVDGVHALLTALQKTSRHVQPVIFGRPAHIASPSFSDELRDLLDVADGIGISGVNDMDGSALSQLSSKSASRQKKLAIHAGEKDRSDIETAVSLKPDLLIHMTQSTPDDLKTVADEGIPITVCVRSNMTTGVGIPPVLDMLDAGIRVSVGTDNIMLNSPDMFEEIHFLSKIYGLSDDTVFRMATSAGADAVDCRFTGSIEVGKKADLLILNAKSSNLKYVKDPLAGYARRARTDDILGII
ncbi:MAG: amidohydrolase family protein [Methanimicrococcus sp.]|nr:amidohydrolase family protein [Methanimicrococcus sp.]